MPTASLHFSPRGEVKCAKSPSARGARRLAPIPEHSGVLEQYDEHAEQAQRSRGGLIPRFGRQVVTNAG